MLPGKLFRTQNGSVFEESTEAQNESAQEAALQLINLLTDDQMHCQDGGTLIDERAEIKKAINTLAKALEGKLVTTYVI